MFSNLDAHRNVQGSFIFVAEGNEIIIKSTLRVGLLEETFKVNYN